MAVVQRSLEVEATGWRYLSISPLNVLACPELPNGSGLSVAIAGSGVAGFARGVCSCGGDPTLGGSAVKWRYLILQIVILCLLAAALVLWALAFHAHGR